MSRKRQDTKNETGRLENETAKKKDRKKTQENETKKMKTTGQ